MGTNVKRHSKYCLHIYLVMSVHTVLKYTSNRTQLAKFSMLISGRSTRSFLLWISTSESFQGSSHSLLIFMTLCESNIKNENSRKKYWIGVGNLMTVVRKKKKCFINAPWWPQVEVVWVVREGPHDHIIMTPCIGLIHRYGHYTIWDEGGKGRNGQGFESAWGGGMGVEGKGDMGMKGEWEVEEKW